jgi:HAD superfamily hydrolase (TIGR01509 family)
MKTTPLVFQKYKLFIFDWDGTLIDSLESYKLWDKVYVEQFYGVDLPIKYFDDLAKRMKTITIGNAENPYFRYLDTKYGNGETPMAKIWENIYSLSRYIQSKTVYQKDAPDVLKLLRLKTGMPITLATNAVMKDILYYSSDESQTAELLSPTDFFDDVLTSDHIEKPKPDPEIFQKLIDRYAVEPQNVLIFEDSLSGVQAARLTGADVVAIFAEDKAKAYADYVFNNWAEMISLLNEDLS